MSHVVRRLRPDGIVELRPRDVRVERPEWYLGAYTTFLVSGALFISTAVPAQLVAITFLGCLLGEVCFALRALAGLRRPLAEVEVLAPMRRVR